MVGWIFITSFVDQLEKNVTKQSLNLGPQKMADQDFIISAIVGILICQQTLNRFSLAQTFSAQTSEHGKRLIFLFLTSWQFDNHLSPPYLTVESSITLVKAIN
jgi:hypothetical protein